MTSTTATKPPAFKRKARAPEWLLGEIPDERPRVTRPTPHQQLRARMVELPGGPRRLLGDYGPVVTGIFTDSPALAEWLGK